MGELYTVPLAAEDDSYDSAIDVGLATSSTASMTSSILRYREENGRTYHAYKDGKYMYPNDEAENDRLDCTYLIRLA